MDKIGKPSYLGHRARLRRKFGKGGEQALLEHEMLELLLTFAIPRRDTKPLAWALIKKFGSLNGVLDASEQELSEVEGIGANSALLIHVVRATMRKYYLEQIKARKEIKTPQSVVDFCRASLQCESNEVFEIIYLTSRSTVIDVERITIGTIDRASISPRKIVESALKKKAAALIFVHNHPSGEPSPSREDIELTEAFTKIASSLGIAVMDHIIVGRGKFFSIRANCEIKSPTEIL